MVRKTKEDAQVTRNRILDAAIEVFSRQGVSQTSLKDIAVSAGVTRGAIYWHFSDKVAIINAIIERSICPLMLKNPERETMIQNDPMGFMWASTREFVGKMVNNPDFRKVFEILWHKCEYVGDMAVIRDKYLEEGETHVEILHRIMTMAQEKGQLDRSLTPHQASIGLVALLDGLILNWTKRTQLFSLEDYAFPILETYFRGLGYR
ncbi:MAG: TetR family transcriptional regulator [Azovibrio sp.]